jgi:L-lactate dehydrogenase
MKIGIIGAGFVGSTIAYATLLRKAATEIVLIDIDRSRAAAESADISHAIPFSHPAKVYSGDYSDLKNCEIIIITAGVNQKKGETRIDLINRNAGIIEEIIPKIVNVMPETKILVTTNPVDVITHLVNLCVQRAGADKIQVFGSGTTLDTARFRSLLSNILGVDPHHVHGYVIGEHGDSEVLTWSIIDIAGLPLGDFIKARQIRFDDKMRQKIDTQVRQAAYSIIEGKGATYYGIGAAVAHIIDIIAHRQRTILTICSPLIKIAGINNITLSMPHLISNGKIVASLPLHLDKTETEALHRSAEIIKEQIVSHQKI